MRANIKPEKVKLKPEVKNPKIFENVLKSELIHSFAEKGIFVKEKVVLKSGKESDFYINVKAAIGYPKIVDMMKKLFELKLQETSFFNSVTNIVGSGLGGHTLAPLVMSFANLYAGYDRGTRKGYGTSKVWEGKVPSVTDKTIIIDDVYSNGTSVNGTLESLESEVGTSDMVEGILVVVNRTDPQRTFHTTSNGRKIPIISLFDENDFQSKIV